MTAPVVTAVIAAYRAGDYLREAIASALGQTFADLEVLVSDDASDPEVRQLVESFGDPRVRYRGNSRRLGPAGNHWAAFGSARGRYLAILNHDDLWRPGFLAALVPRLDGDPAAILAFCDHDVIDSAGRTLTRETDRTTRHWGRDRLAPGPRQPFADLVVAQTIPLAMGGLFRRAAIKDATLPDVGPAYDFWLAYELSRGGAAAWYVPDRLTAWRVHPTQITGRGDLAWAAGSVACLLAMEADPLFRSHQAAVRTKLARGACAAAKQLLVQGDPVEARRYAWLAIRRRWFDWRAWVFCGLSRLGRFAACRVIGLPQPPCPP